MKRGLLALALLAGCTRTTELLPERTVVERDAAAVDTAVTAIIDTAVTDTAIAPATAVDIAPRTKFPFCPTLLDVYAGTNGLFPGCGAFNSTNPTMEEGWFAPGTAGYDGTLAGRLLSRLAGDPDLVPRFGADWTVRSCATFGQTLTQLVPTMTSDLCGRSAPELMANSTHVCTKNPSPFMLLSTSMSDDGCHGGSMPPDRPADPAGYTQHVAQRLEAFLAIRQPQAVLLGAQTEWTTPPSQSSIPSGEECAWQRPDWDARAVQLFGQTHATPAAVVALPDQHPVFIRHHHCCRQLDLGGCATEWYGKGEVLNCDGAQALVDFWYQQLKSFLIFNDFECP